MPTIVSNSSDFYRKIRPEYFSDSKLEQEVLLRREYLAYELSLLSTNMKQDLFENLARRMVEEIISPNLIPQTGPTGGGDGKTDSESYAVSELISDRWFIVGGGCKKDENWAFAMSVKTDWKTKIRSDVKKIVETGRGYTKIYFISNQLISSKNRSNIQDELKNKYKVDIVILDGNWILEKIYSNNLINLVIDSLNLSESFKTKNVLGKNDIARKEELEKLEINIKNTDRYFEYDIQLVYDALESALYSRMLELPKDEVIGRFERAKRFNKKINSKKFEIKISYQLAWTYFMYYSDYDYFLNEFNEFKSYFNENYDIGDVELYNNLITLLNGLSSQLNLSEKGIDIKLENDYFINILDKFESKTDVYNTSCLLSTFFKSNLLIVNGLKDGNDISLYINKLNFILDKSKNLLDFPFKVFKDIIKVLGEFLINSKEFDLLIDNLADFESKRNSEKSGGITFLERGMQKLDGGNYKESIIYFGKSIFKLAKDESKDYMYFSLIGLSTSYFELGLKYSYYNSIITALHLQIKEFFDGGKINKSVITILKEIIKNEILIGRIPYILIYTELYQILSTQTLEESKENREKFLSEIDLFLSIRLLNSDISIVSKYTFLPDLFDEFDFIFSKNIILYLFGQIELIDKELISGFSEKGNLEDFINKMKSQPLVKQFLGKTDFQDKDNVILKSKILGVEIFIKGNGNILFYEELLAYLESFFATGDFIKDIAGKIGNIEINIDFTDKEDDIMFNSKLNFHIYNVNINKELKDIGKTFFTINGYILANSFIIQKMDIFLEKLFKKEEVNERITIALNHEVIIKNILGNNAKLFINDWDKSNYKKYDVKNINNSANNKTQGESLENNEIQNNFNRHDSITISSVINNDLWDKAGWNSFGFLSLPNGIYGIYIGFTNKEYAYKIMSEWIELVGFEDINNLIRISIIKGIDKNNPHNYRVSVSSNIDISKPINGGLFQTFTRNHTMTPQNSNNLNILENLYKNKNEYYLYFGTYDINTGKQEILHGGYIKKNELIVKNAWELKANDVEMVSIFSKDDPIIPEGIVNTNLINRINSKK